MSGACISYNSVNTDYGKYTMAGCITIHIIKYYKILSEEMRKSNYHGSIA